jgi:hypothetical protein
MRRPETVAATALVVGQPLGPRSLALPGRTRTGLTAICGGWLEAAPSAARAGRRAAGEGVVGSGARWSWSAGRCRTPGLRRRAGPPPGGMPQVVTVFTTGLASPWLHWITYEHV